MKVGRDKGVMKFFAFLFKWKKNPNNLPADF